MNLTNWLSRVYVGCWRKNRTTFALLETSEFGTFETCRCSLMMSVYRGRAEIVGTWPNRRE